MFKHREGLNLTAVDGKILYSCAPLNEKVCLPNSVLGCNLQLKRSDFLMGLNSFSSGDRFKYPLHACIL